MYSYFKGQVSEIAATHITLEVNNIGYTIRVPNPYNYNLNESLTVYVRQVIREDSNELYGFKTLNEKIMFDKLTSVKGLGPKGALAILASATVEEITGAIEQGKDKFFVSFPGIGTKTSQQIILDLKGKLSFEAQESPNSMINDEVSLALKTLGYSAPEIKSALKAISQNGCDSTQQAIKFALKYLHR